MTDDISFRPYILFHITVRATTSTVLTIKRIYQISCFMNKPQCCRWRFQYGVKRRVLFLESDIIISKLLSPLHKQCDYTNVTSVKLLKYCTEQGTTCSSTMSEQLMSDKKETMT